MNLACWSKNTRAGTGGKGNRCTVGSTRAGTGVAVASSCRAPHERGQGFNSYSLYAGMTLDRTAL